MGDYNMGTIMEIGRSIFPLLIIGIIAVFVIKRLEYKSKQGTLGKKKSKKAQMLLDSLIPLGSLAGIVVTAFLSLFFNISFFSIIGLGAGFGLLAGYIAYEIYSNKKEEEYS